MKIAPYANFKCTFSAAAGQNDTVFVWIAAPTLLLLAEIAFKVKFQLIFAAMGAALVFRVEDTAVAADPVALDFPATDL